jgi:hypothetical protein
MCVCVTRFSGRGASVLAFFGELTALVVVCGGCSVGSGEGRLTRGTGDVMFSRVGIARSVRGGLVGLAGVVPSV